MVELTIDGRAVQAEPGTTLLGAATDAGVYIPHLCAHPNLPTQGGCKLCVVEIDGQAGPVQSCEVAVAQGMVVRTKTDQTQAIRNVALELILAPHPKDCTSCAAYLNCELQALMQYQGVAHSRLREIDKKTKNIGASNEIIAKEMFRCIQCGRCIRACDDLRGVGILKYNHRDGEVYIGTIDDLPHNETDCRFCSACVEVCPTGAIMDVFGVLKADDPKWDALVPCQNSCPAHTEIPLYLQLAGDEKYADSVAVFREKLTFPLSLGYICSHVCESDCKRGKIDQPLSIRATKRFAVENDAEEYWRERVWRKPATGNRVAVVGAGATGLTAAWYLQRLGHEVTVHERQARPGGMLSYGIPRYRLPQEVVDGEIQTLLDEAPFTIKCDSRVDDVQVLKEQGFDAVIVAVGAQAGKRPPAYQGAWPNVHDGVDLCRRWSEGELPELGRVVSVYGGGNVAFDCARSAKKWGAEVVRIMCLEPADKMLADPEELADALAESIEIINGVSMGQLNPEPNPVTAFELYPVSRFQFTPDGGLDLQVDQSDPSLYQTDSLIFATGQMGHLDPRFGLARGRGNLILAKGDGSTELPGIFAAGDAVYGTRTVVMAVAAGRRVASSVDRFLGGDGDIEDHFYDRPVHNPVIGTIPDFAQLRRTDCRTSAAVTAEVARCLHCELRRDIDPVRYWTDASYKTARTAAR